MFEKLTIGELNTDQSDEIRRNVTDLSVSLTMDGTSQLSFTVIDPDFKMHEAGYFVIRRPVYYEDIEYGFEVTSVEVSGGPDTPQVTVEARTAAIQKLKRDKGQKGWGNLSPTAFAATLAKEVDLKFFGTTSAAKGAITRVHNENTDESSWDVLGRLASDLQFVVFEAGGILYFASEANLVSSQPHVVFSWPSKADDAFYLHSINLRRSDDDVWGASLECTVDRTNGTSLRPGMSIDLRGIKYFGDRYYLITAVEWDEAVPDPVSVQARMIEATPDVGCETKALKLNDTGDCVKRLQQALNAAKLGVTVPVSSTFDTATRDAVKALQRKYNLSETGRMNKATWAVLASAPGIPADEEEEEGSGCADTTLQRGSTGDCVKELQRLLNSNGAALTVDGVFGSLTKAAVEAFQTSSGLTADGVADSEVWEALGA